MNVTDLGFSAEELRALVIERAADKLCGELLGVDMGEYAEDAVSKIDSKVKSQIDLAVKPAIDAAIAKHVAPFVEGELETIVFQQASEWGEKKGEPMTFRQVVVERADAYLREPVNAEGKDRRESGSSFFDGKTPRVTWMVDRHLQHHITSAMSDALKDLNSKVAHGLMESVRGSINAALAGLKVEVKTK